MPLRLMQTTVGRAMLDLDRKITESSMLIFLNNALHTTSKVGQYGPAVHYCSLEPFDSSMLLLCGLAHVAVFTFPYRMYQSYSHNFFLILFSRARASQIMNAESLGTYHRPVQVLDSMLHLTSHTAFNVCF